jgi:hypothetical protein
VNLFVHDQMRPFKRNRRVDLLAPNTPEFSGGRFVVYENRTKKGQVEVIKAIVPYAQRRTDVATPSESFEMIDPMEGDGFFAYTPLKAGQPPIIVDVNFNSPRAAAGPLNNNERQIASGISHLSSRPWVDANRGWPDYFAFAIESEVLLQVTFEILPPSTSAAALPPGGQFQIGPGVGKSVDFAGVIIAGVVMPQYVFNKLVENVQERLK